MRYAVHGAARYGRAPGELCYAESPRLVDKGQGSNAGVIVGEDFRRLRTATCCG